jgi:Uma2 family endonuclease
MTPTNPTDLPASSLPEEFAPPETLPNIEDLIIEDGAAVDRIFTEKQQRLLTEPLYSSWSGPDEGRPFVVLANVGLFFVEKQTALVPDVMLSLDVAQDNDYSVKANNTYLVWQRGKVPDVVIEIVSDRRGDEEGYMMRQYGRWRILYYVIFDPDEHLGQGVLRAFVLREGVYEPVEPTWLKRVGLGLVFWEGSYEGSSTRWLRWCDRQGQVIPTGSERAEQERQRRERLEAQLRAMGIDPVP